VHSVLYEVKGQPDAGYDAQSDKLFASWAPDEESDESGKYLEALAYTIGSFVSTDL
jgi:hypothetical protein